MNREIGIERKRFSGERRKIVWRRRKIMGKEIVLKGERKENESREEREIGKMKGGGKRERERRSERREEGDKFTPVQSC